MMLDGFPCNINENTMEKADGDETRARKVLSTNSGN